MLKSIGFELLVASPPEYENLVVEIYYEGKFVALIADERQNGDFIIEMPGVGLDEQRIVRRVELQGFLDAVKQAQDRLLKKI